MLQTFAVVKVSLQTGRFTLLDRYLRSQLFVWVGVLMVYTILCATRMLLHLCAAFSLTWRPVGLEPGT